MSKLTKIEALFFAKFSAESKNIFLLQFVVDFY